MTGIRQYCPKCGSEKVQSRGRQIYCNNCKRCTSVPLGDRKNIERGDNYIRIVCASARIRSVEDAIREFDIDTNEWEVKPPVRIKTSEGYRKDRTVTWKVVNGVVEEGTVEDSGKMLVVPLYHIEILFVRKTQEIRAHDLVGQLLKDAAVHMPRQPKRKTIKGGMLYEIDMPDLHFGKLTWAEESGENYDIKIAQRMALDAIDKLLSFSKMHKIERFLFPFGNDFFNVDNKQETTTGGTPQQEDTRWQKTFMAGQTLVVNIIDSLASIAPVDVLVIPGNHDETRTFYLGATLAAWYRNNKNVTVNNEARKRKYYTFGNVLIGLTHGYHEKIAKLPFIMPVEVPQLWAASKVREWHLGDKHHKKDMLYRTEDNNGVTIRILRSLSATDTWHFDNGFIGAPRAAEAFLWHPSEGLIAQYNAYADGGLNSSRM